MKNQRFKRAPTLDVKQRSRQARAAVMRLVFSALSFALGILLVAFGLWRGGQFILEQVYQDDTFAVKRIEVYTSGVISPEQLRKWSGVKLGDKLLALDLMQIKRNLELVPLIKSAAVERLLPNTLRLRVVEREPLAQAHALTPRPDGQGYDIIVYYLDSDGYAILPLESWMRPRQIVFPNSTLPVLSGFSSVELQPGRAVESSQIQSALRLISAFEHSTMSRVASLWRIDIATPQVLRVTTGLGSEVTLATNRLDWQLRRWRAVHDFGQQTGRAIGKLDLSVTNNLPVLWVDSAPPYQSGRLNILKQNKQNV